MFYFYKTKYFLATCLIDLLRKKLSILLIQDTLIYYTKEGN